MKRFIFIAIFIAFSISLFAQNESSNTGVRRRVANEKTVADEKKQKVTDRAIRRQTESPVDDSELQWKQVIYRKLDLTKEKNATLYYPEDVMDGSENLFRIIINRMSANQLAGYEYLDGKEVFNDENRVKMADVFDRFHIPYTDAKGSSERNPHYLVDEADVPVTEVLSYYIIERWEFDKRNNRMRTHVDAICPVLHRPGDFGGEDIRYPMFWVKYEDLQPYLLNTVVFTSDANTLASTSYDDYFRLRLYDGEIYKTRNLRNKSLMELYPDEESLAHAQDSIQRRLDSFENGLWVPSLEELESDSTATAQKQQGKSYKKSTVRSKRGKGVTASKSKPAKVKKPKSSKSSGSVTRSVRSRK